MLGQATDPPPDCSARPTDPRSIKPHPGAAGPVCPALRGTRPGPPRADRRPACRPRRGRAMVLAAAEGARAEVTGAGRGGRETCLALPSMKWLMQSTRSDDPTIEEVF